MRALNFIVMNRNQVLALVISIVLIASFLYSKFEGVGPNIHLANATAHEHLKWEMRNLGISFNTEVMGNGNEHIFWNEEDDEKVRELIEIVIEEYY
ncbi:hypothetical protein BCF53_1415 [Reinekea marinisedimentorum]|uniref:Uncharacterized protein n=1 Tax=Reinekea marinisedimentorum TaxID=230495 RepID=A0A4R3HVC5_9GAMM|nr:hypothetical protein BCF53_1415 [Reinekea marinisedimentorum]